MGTDVTCADCGTLRINAAFSNTRYCKACRLLRDLAYLGDRTKTCDHCSRTFAPASRRDPHCGPCCYGSLDEGHCAICKRSDAELYRKEIAVCTHCVRDPMKRRSIVAGLRKGQATRRLENGHQA